MPEDPRFREVNLGQAFLGSLWTMLYTEPTYPGQSLIREVRGYQRGCLLKWSRAHVSLLRWF